jgi:beta-N-acetylhexosaminidase
VRGLGYSLGRSVGATAIVCVLAGCAGGSVATEPLASAAPSQPSVSIFSPDPNTPTGWGPTVGELAAAQNLVSSWTPDQLAGQVIVGRWRGTEPDQAAGMVADLHLAGVQLTGSNIVDEQQVRAVNAAVSESVAASGRTFPPVIGVDQEGGAVAHLRGVTTDLPPFAASGPAVAAGEGGVAAVREAMSAAAVELRGLGFTWIFAPVADVTIGSADPTIGSRSPSTDPVLAGAAATAAVQGYTEAATVSTVKHFPGHGAATEDSHLTLPTLSASMAELEQRDIPPFAQAIAAGAPAVMIGHLDVQALAPGVPSSLAPQTYTYLRDTLGFQGVAITDSLGMGGVMSKPHPGIDALLAGADLLLMPADTRATHEALTQAITTGEVPRARAEQAAARVVALQMWQQRSTADSPVPADAAARTVESVQRMLSLTG